MHAPVSSIDQIINYSVAISLAMNSNISEESLLISQGLNGLQALIVEVITEPLDDQVALARSHWLVVDAENQCLVSLLDCDASRSLFRSI